jgi:hypothetical protein
MWRLIRKVREPIMGSLKFQKQDAGVKMMLRSHVDCCDISKLPRVT